MTNITKINGIGPKVAGQILEAVGVDTVEEFAKLTKEQLVAVDEVVNASLETVEEWYQTAQSLTSETATIEEVVEESLSDLEDLNDSTEGTVDEVELEVTKPTLAEFKETCEQLLSNGHSLINILRKAAAVCGVDKHKLISKVEEELTVSENIDNIIK